MQESFASVWNQGPGRASFFLGEGEGKESYLLSSLYHWNSARPRRLTLPVPFCPTGAPVPLASEMYGGSTKRGHSTASQMPLALFSRPHSSGLHEVPENEAIPHHQGKARRTASTPLNASGMGEHLGLFSCLSPLSWEIANSIHRMPHGLTVPLI